MPRFDFKAEWEEGSFNLMSVHEEGLEEVIEHFRQFLAACGFFVDGHLEFVPRDLESD